MGKFVRPNAFGSSRLFFAYFKKIIDKREKTWYNEIAPIGANEIFIMEETIMTKKNKRRISRLIALL
jgi:hypothetical protein